MIWVGIRGHGYFSMSFPRHHLGLGGREHTIFAGPIGLLRLACCDEFRPVNHSAYTATGAHSLMARRAVRVHWARLGLLAKQTLGGRVSSAS